MQVPQLYILSILRYIKKNSTDVTTLNHEYNTRNRLHAGVKKVSKSTGQRCFLYHIPKIYNAFQKFINENIENTTFNYNYSIWIKKFCKNLTKIDYTNILNF